MLQRGGGWLRLQAMPTCKGGMLHTNNPNTTAATASIAKPACTDFMASPQREVSPSDVAGAATGIGSALIGVDGSWERDVWVLLQLIRCQRGMCCGGSRRFPITTQVNRIFRVRKHVLHTARLQLFVWQGCCCSVMLLLYQS